MRVDDLLMDDAKVYINRLKGSTSLVHPIAGDELRLLRRYISTRKQQTGQFLPWLFLSEQNTQLHRNTVINILKQASKLGKIRHVSPHMLRHGCGYYLANKNVPLRVIQDYLGHRDVNNTVKYTKLS